jgi:hypothetical protein
LTAAKESRLVLQSSINTVKEITAFLSMPTHLKCILVLQDKAPQGQACGLLTLCLFYDIKDDYHFQDL